MALEEPIHIDDFEDSFLHSGSSIYDDMLEEDDIDMELHEAQKKKAKSISRMHQHTERKKSLDESDGKLEPPSPCKTCTRACKTFCLSTITNLLLLFLVSAYVIFGGVLFFSLESRLVRVHQDYLDIEREEYVERLLDVTTSIPYVNMTSKSKWSRDANKILEEFQTFVVKEEALRLKSHTEEWNLMSSIIYSVALITTIGYGNLAPLTDEGRVVTIWYSLIGIPLTLLYLTRMGAIMAKVFKLTYNKICAFSCRKIRPAKDYSDTSKRVPVFVTLIVLIAYVAAGAVLFQVLEKRWDFINSAYFCFVTLSTIGHGDFVFGFNEISLDPWKQLVCAVYLVLGLSLVSMAFNLLHESIWAKYKMITRGIEAHREGDVSDSEWSSSSL
ncbi:potassium channel subfamily K member 18-like [Biomphalaria glabrata]|uniref:Potassium channel subfamily K member 18-like n=1 Tax=Biomphalaria glabrata TaxID=6526 RepID=A0A9W2YHG0_BIOGL|nr:potassium channel subfamily K member 18-like [Biomphalaria glabrata]